MKRTVGLVSKGIIFLCLELICISIIYFGFLGKRNATWIGIFLAVLFGIILWKGSEAVTIKNEKIFLLGLAVVCFVTKIFAVSFFSAVPVADYQTYYEFAEKMTYGYRVDYNNLYLALYPHVFGYAEFLSVFFKIFGNSASLAILLNVILTVVSMVFIYKIGKYLGGGKMAVACAVLWILFPSQSLWNGFVLSEPLYTMLLLAFWYVCLYLKREKKNGKLTTGLAVLAGVLLSMFHMIRPIGLIVLVALVISLFFVRITEVNRKHILVTVVLVCTFLLGNKIVNYHVESRIGMATGRFSWYNVSVGLEESSGGKWNQEDWDRVLGNANQFQQAGISEPAKEAQQLEKGVALKKAKQLKNPMKLLRQKFKSLLKNDSSGIIIHMKYSQIQLSEKVYTNIDYITNSFYFMIVILTIGAGIIFLFDKKYQGIEFIYLYVIGLTLGHMVVEVQERYHYSILVGFVMGAGYCVSRIAERMGTTSTAHNK